MFDHVDVQIAQAEAHYQQLLEEARIERLCKPGNSYRATAQPTVRRLLFSLGGFLITLGQRLCAACDVAPLPVPGDKRRKLKVL